MILRSQTAIHRCRRVSSCCLKNKDKVVFDGLPRIVSCLKLAKVLGRLVKSGIGNPRAADSLSTAREPATYQYINIFVTGNYCHFTVHCNFTRSKNDGPGLGQVFISYYFRYQWLIINCELWAVPDWPRSKNSKCYGPRASRDLIKKKTKLITTPTLNSKSQSFHTSE